MRRAAIAIASVALTAVVSAQSPSRDWPQYLGANRNGTASFEIPATATFAEAWRKPIGAAMSGISVAGGRALTLSSDGEDDYLVALDAATGRELWQFKIGRTHADAVTNGPGSTPAVGSNLAFVIGSSCRFVAVNTADGRLAWDVDFAATFKTRFAKRNSCFISPMLLGSVVVMPTGSAEADRLVAYEAQTGKQLWSAPGMELSLNTHPAYWEHNGAAQVLYHYVKPPGSSGLAGVNIKDGSKAWEIDAKAISNTAPLNLGGGRVLLQLWAGSGVIEFGGSAPPRYVWQNDALIALPVPAVHVGGYIYGFGGNSGEYLTCVDAATGEKKWTSRIYRGALAVTGKTLVMQSEGSGLLRLIAADPSAYRELARITTIKPGAPTLAAPTVADGRIYVRNLEEIVAVSVK